MICNCCLKEKEEYVSGLCEECSYKMDNYIESVREEVEKSGEGRIIK